MREKDKQVRLGFANEGLLGVVLISIGIGLIIFEGSVSNYIGFVALWEELGLCLAGMILLMVSGAEYHGKWALRSVRFIVLTYSLPFFFTLTYLQNGELKFWSLGILFAFIALTSYMKPKFLWPSIFIGTFVAVVINDLLGSGQIPGDVYIVMASCFAVVLYFSYHNSILEREYREYVEVTNGMGATIAHELRTPLTTISIGVKGVQEAILDLQKQGVIDKDFYINDLMNNVTSSCERAHMTINLFLANLKSISKDDLEPCSMQNCIEESIEEFPTSTRDRGVIRVINSCSDFDFMGNKDMIKHVFFNLYKNGLHYTHDKDDRKIEVSFGIKDNRGWVKVYDNGTGINSEALPYIFDQYYTRRRSGMGLGLYFSKRCVEEYGGKIRCNSEPGHYTEFMITLPIFHS